MNNLDMWVGIPLTSVALIVLGFVLALGIHVGNNNDHNESENR